MTGRKILQKVKPAEMVASSDIKTEILIRLPLKKLIQFQLVSKQWFSFIKNPGFDRLRDSHQIQTAIRHFASCTDFESIRYVDFFPIIISRKSTNTPQRSLINLSKDPNGTRILQSCNGLLLCSNFRVSENCWKYFVFDTNTNEFSVIRDEPDCVKDGLFVVLGVSLAFDPSKSPHYKAVCVVRLKSGAFIQIYVYCSKTSVWRMSGGEREPFKEPINYEDGIYWNGAVHWIGQYLEFLCYDIEHEVFKKMPFPSTRVLTFNRISSHKYLVESRDCLSFVEILHKPGYVFELYQMTRDYSDWHLKHRVDLLPVCNAYSQIIGPVWDSCTLLVISAVIGEKDEDSFLVLGTPGKAVRYNLSSQIIEKLHGF